MFRYYYDNSHGDVTERVTLTPVLRDNLAGERRISHFAIFNVARRRNAFLPALLLGSVICTGGDLYASKIMFYVFVLGPQKRCANVYFIIIIIIITARPCIGTMMTLAGRWLPKSRV